MTVGKYLDALEAQIDPGVERDLQDQWRAFSCDEFTGDLFTPVRKRKVAWQQPWPQVSVNQAIADMDQMLLAQFGACASTLSSENGAVLCVRANYGTSILPSLFGVEIFYMEEQHNTLPTSRPLAGGKAAIRKLIQQGIPKLEQSIAGQTLEMGHHFVETMNHYPMIKKHVFLYHPDLQGPMDVCEVVWGSDLFLDIMDEPNLVKEFLELVTETYIVFMRAWQRIVPPNETISAHWGLMHKGQVMLRDDSAMNFSPQLFDEFIKPYDQRLLAEFGGGAIHFCGRGDHYISSASRIPNLFGINMSQPEYNDMEIIYQNTVDKGIKLIGLSRATAEEALRNGRSLHSNVQCW